MNPTLETKTTATRQWFPIGVVPLAPLVTPETAAGAWNFNPLIALALALVAWRYMDGVWRLWRRSGAGRGVSRRQVVCFWLGMAALVVALISPVDALGETLLSAHMGQHLLLMLVAPPLLVLGMPPAALAWALPPGWGRPLAHWWHRRSWLRRLWHFISRPSVAWTLNAAIVWLWHLPGPYQAAVNEPGIHMLEHLSFIGVSLLFWWPVLSTSGRRRLGNGPAILYLFTTAIHSSILGALMTLARSPWYPVYEPRTVAWGLTALQDQQAAGAIMWVPGGMVYALAVVLLTARWLQTLEARDNAAATAFAAPAAASERDGG